MSAIEAEGLRRAYDFQVPEGELFGLLSAERLVGAVYGILGYALLRWFETLSRTHASLERS